MGYSYGLFRVIDENVDHLSKIGDQTILPLGNDFETIKATISTLLPLIGWLDDYGQIIDPNWGRFECHLSKAKDRPVIVFTTSYHVDYEKEVINVAKHLKLSVFDAQSGERVYLQDS